MTDSWLSSLAALPEAERAAAIAELSEADAEALLHDWRVWARENQIAPAGLAWTIWLILAGRGFGKTRCGAEWLREKHAAGAMRMALVGPTAADVRDVMVEGESGLLSIYPKRDCPKYEPSKRRLTWPNGAVATCYSAEEPERLRGPQHEVAWCDEVGAWRYPEDTWDMLMMGLRLGLTPQVGVTTTPKPTKLLRALLKDPTCVVTRGSTYENKDNLAPAFYTKVIAKYEGTRLGRQELLAEMLEDTPGALWSIAMLESTRVKVAPAEMTRVVIAIDPAVSSNEDSDETGIIACGKIVADDGTEHGYVLDDVSGRYSPGEWAAKAINLMHKWNADRIVAEVNNGGEMVGHTLHTVDQSVPFKAVHASRGKRTRAEPVAALYEQGRIHHVGVFSDLESQQCTYVPDSAEASPDRMDAAVWGFTELMLGGTSTPRIRTL